ncbi:MAG: hypothetical protein F6K24_33205, partial [Okeania sp. SIO2D1]|nr:hypothetical protein [Okeania sp. SIO2D1]
MQFGGQFLTILQHLELPESLTVDIEEAQDILARIEKETGIKPALIYAIFAPTS